MSSQFDKIYEKPSIEKDKVCCFIGHRKIQKTQMLVNRLTTTIENLILNKNVGVFLFGSKSQFDDLCLEIVTRLKQSYPHIKRVYVRSMYQNIGKDYETYLLSLYDETYFPKNLVRAGKSAYVQRNRAMIDGSDYCVFYYDKNYVPQRAKKYFDFLPSKSGTSVAFEYAQSKKVEIINVFCDF
jgi:uncharacterized phage-like protein YoqJ